MVLLGLGILAASLTFFLYRIDLFRWRQLLDFGKRRREDGRRITQKKDEDAGRTERKESSSQAKIQMDELETFPMVEKPFLVNAPEISIQLPGDGTSESKEGETTPKAKDFKSAKLRPSDEHNKSPAFRIDSPTRNEYQSITKSPSDPPRIAEQLRQTPQSLMPPPSLSRSSNLQAQRHQPNTLMSAAPPRSSTFLKPLPKTTGSLNPPPSAASTLRGPPRGSPNGLTPPPSQLTSSTFSPNSSSKPSRKVLLSPGHSPLDWAHLTTDPPTPTFLRGANIPPQLIRVPPSLLKYQNGRKGRDAWSTWHGKVYNLTPYLDFHPGGRGELLRGAGKVGEAERLFLEIHPWVNWENMLSKCLVGFYVEQEPKGENEE
ncbi:MAG: hypothetical protein MMC33_009257 [Icmadophila ericetorum]|nr:hypothetical protein [Icmadophila ericetorum]